MSEGMKWDVTVSVKSVHGHQVFRVEADSKEEALEKFYKEGGDFVCEELEVTDLGTDWITVDDIEEATDDEVQP